MHGVDLKPFFCESDLERARCIANGMDHILGDEDKKKIYLRETTALKQAETLCRSLLSEKERILSAYFEAVRAGVSKITGIGKIPPQEINRRINELLKASIKSEGVVNVFANLPEFSIFDPEYLEKIKKMDQKNLAAEMLQKLLADEISVYQRTNLVKSQLFSEKMEELMRRYRNSLITNAEVIEELLKMAGEIRKANEDGNALGLTGEEQAFYDAITKPEHIKEFYDNDILKAMTLELTEELRKSRTIDWQLKESARASMRSKIKRLLKKYKYPPEGQEKALEYVIHQAELMSDNMSVYDMERPVRIVT
jgi:type I restriction enzyme R subunit